MKWIRTKRMIVAFDFSDDSVEAVRIALNIVDSHDCLHIVHVVEPLPANDPFVIWDQDCDEKRKQRARESVEERIAGVPLDQVHIDIGLGRPAQVIVDMAEDIEAGLIIIPSHGASGLRRMMMGSVAEHVVRLAHCPVLVLKDSEQDAAA